MSDKVVCNCGPYVPHSDNSNFLLFRWGGEIAANNANGGTRFDFRQLTTQHFSQTAVGELCWKLNSAQCLYKIIVGVVLVSHLVAK